MGSADLEESVVDDGGLLGPWSSIEPRNLRSAISEKEDIKSSSAPDPSVHAYIYKSNYGQLYMNPRSAGILVY